MDPLNRNKMCEVFDFHLLENPFHFQISTEPLDGNCGVGRSREVFGGFVVIIIIIKTVTG